MHTWDEESVDIFLMLRPKLRTNLTGLPIQSVRYVFYNAIAEREIFHILLHGFK